MDRHLQGFVTYADGCRSALRLGEELLDLLHRPVAEQETQRIQSLVAQRGTVVEQLHHQTAADPSSEGAVGLLQALAEQQALLQDRFQQAISELKKLHSGSQKIQSNMESFRRIMTGQRSHSLNRRT